MVYPDYLKKGDAVAIVAPAGRLKSDFLPQALRILEQWGLEPISGKHIHKTHGDFAGTDAERLEDVQAMIDNTEIKAIFFARGGYGSARIIQKINFTALKQKPKWLIGFSDITIFHSYLNNVLFQPSLHAVMPLSFTKCSPAGLTSLKDTLFGKPLSYALMPNENNKYGKASGTLLGGNLTILLSTRGSALDFQFTKDAILFIEEVGEKQYHIERMLLNFKLGGVFNKFKGIIFGSFSESGNERFLMPTDFYSMTKELLSDFEGPIIYDFPAGHIIDNRCLILGANVQMEVNDKGAGLCF